MYGRRIGIKYQGCNPRLDDMLTRLAGAIGAEFSDRPLGNGQREMSFIEKDGNVLTTRHVFETVSDARLHLRRWAQQNPATELEAADVILYKMQRKFRAKLRAELRNPESSFIGEHGVELPPLLPRIRARKMASQKFQLRPMSPFEGMPDVRLFVLVAALSGICVFILGGILRWTAAAVVSFASLYVFFRLATRLFPRYARLHNSLALRYWASVALHTNAAERAGKPPVANEDFVCRFLSDAVYLKLDPDSARDLLHEAQFKATNFTDRDALLEEFARRYPGLDRARFGIELEQLVRSEANASPVLPGYVAEWLFADVIERRYGTAERVRYLADVVTGRTRIGISRSQGLRDNGSEDRASFSTN